jgi:hypothetical protein
VLFSLTAVCVPTVHAVGMRQAGSVVSDMARE